MKLVNESSNQSRPRNKSKRPVKSIKLEGKNLERVNYYNNLVKGMGEGNSENLNDWAKRRTCRVYNCSEEALEEDIKTSMLTEAEVTLGDAAKAASEISAVPVEAEQKGQIETALDQALARNLKVARHGGNQFINLLLVGDSGAGKSGIVRSWAAENNINLFEVHAQGMDPTDFSAITPDLNPESATYKTIVRLASTEFDPLNRPRSVLFLDEYNRAPSSVRADLLEIINNHNIIDPRQPNNLRHLENLLFTVAAINPPNSAYDTDRLETAERRRFKSIDVIMEPSTLLKYLNKKFNKELQEAEEDGDKEEVAMIKGRISLANTILTNKLFNFDSREDVVKAAESDETPLNYASLETILLDSDGTKEDFLNLVPQYVRSNSLPMFKEILRNYKDVDDKANDALKGGTSSKVFGKATSNYEKIMAILD